VSLKAKRWGCVPAPKVDNWRHELGVLPEWMTAPETEKLTPFEKAWMAWCRGLPCSRCGRPAPSDPAHLATGPGQKGVARKVDISQVVPLCRPCHRWIDGHAGTPPSAEERRELGRNYIERTRDLAIPGDSRDQALALQEAGIGWIELLGGGRWAWHEGTRPDYAPKVTLNAPTEEGRAVGLVIAKLCDEKEAALRAAIGRTTPERCKGCAGRAGSDANASMQTLADFTECLATGEPFFCHAGLDLEGDPNPEPKFICRAWIAMARPEDVARVEAVVAGSAT
jgi:hypothetical protein